MAGHRARIRISLAGLLLLSCAACIAASIFDRGPIVQTEADNYLVRFHRCTAIARGWPWAYRSRFPEGYVNPWEPLAWDIDPVFEATSNLALIADVAVIATLGIGGFLLIRR
jgi:hypothetical protein